MLADLTGVAISLEKDTFASRLERKRAEILSELRQKGQVQVTEGGQTFNLVVKPETGEAANRLGVADARRVK